MLCLDECNNCLPKKKKKSKEIVGYLNRIFFFPLPYSIIIIFLQFLFLNTMGKLNIWG